MTIWTPDLDESSGPRYQAIADALAEDVAAGRLEGGARLPTHRELARRLGVTVGTVSRAYAEAEQRGLVQGEVGRGTFVRQGGQQGAGEFGRLDRDERTIDLGASVPPAPQNAEEEALMREAFAALARTPELPLLLECQPSAGLERHREAGAAWVRRLGRPASAGQVLVTCGAQHALATVFGTLARPGDTVLTEAVTFPGMKGVASLLGLRLHGLALDKDGLRPDALEDACREGGARFLYVVPTHQNPTGVTMPESRRREIASIAERYELTVVEDDVYHFLATQLATQPLPSLAEMLPERTFGVHSMSKVALPGLRVGFLVAPPSPGLVERLSGTVWATTWMASPPMAEIAARWIADGTMDRLAAWRCEEAGARNDLLQRLWPEHRRPAVDGYHVWLEVPEPWQARDFVLQAKLRGVTVSSPEVFVAGRAAVPHAVRVALSAPRVRGRLEAGLRILREILDAPPDPCVALA